MKQRCQTIGEKRKKRAVVARKKVLRRREAIRAKRKEEREAAKKERDSQREFNRHFVTVRRDKKGEAQVDRQEILKKLQHNAEVLAAVEAADKAGAMAEEKQEDEEGGMIGGCADVSWSPNTEDEAR